MKAHIWNEGICRVCAMRSTWPGARIGCGSSWSAANGDERAAKRRVPKKYKKLPPAEHARRVQRAGEMREAGVAYREIARVLGVYPQLAHTYVEAYRKRRAQTNQPHAAATAGAGTGTEGTSR